jgi:hypothetical protein
MIFIKKPEGEEIESVLGFGVHVTLEKQVKHGWLLRIESDDEDLELVLRGNVMKLRHAIAKEKTRC